MKRWNVSSIFFISATDEVREISLDVEAVNIVTGASGTGKSALIKALDYCLGSSECELPMYVRRRCVGVGVMWKAGDEEMIIGRPVPVSGSSSVMYSTSGRNLLIPRSMKEFEGRGTVASAKSFMERSFGIGDRAEQDLALVGQTKARASVRQVTPYIFVTKEVIDSETVLLHGLEQKDKAELIVSSIPYFLRATDEGTAAAGRKLRQLRKALEIEEAKDAAQKSTTSLTQQRALLLINEAVRLGLISPPDPSASERYLVEVVRSLANSQPVSLGLPDESDLEPLYERRRSVLSRITTFRRELKATEAVMDESKGFHSAVVRQQNKLLIAEQLNLADIPTACPICDSHTEAGVKAARAIAVSLNKIRSESTAVERVQPRIQAHREQIESNILSLNNDLRSIEADIAGVLSQVQHAEHLNSLKEVHAHFRGKVSYFLDTLNEALLKPHRDLDSLRQQIEELETAIDSDAQEVRLRHAEASVSQRATDIFADLPKVAPCVGAELSFSSRKPSVSVIEASSERAVLKMSDVGSDQNYLAIHIALTFGLHRHFKVVSSPVPGLVVLDQVSRPFFPEATGDAPVDEAVISAEDEEFSAVRSHLDFLFNEVKEQEGLQVLLLEHAYFPKDPRYVKATKERWTRASGLALIPRHWPIRQAGS